MVISKSKLPLPHHPNGIERDYLRAILDLLYKNLFSVVLSKIEQSFRKDDLLNQVLIINEFETALTVFEKKVRTLGSQTSHYNKKVWEKQIKTALALDIFLSETWLQKELDTFSKTNIDLIKNIANIHLEKVQKIVNEAVTNGDDFKTITSKIQKEIGVTESRAALIARDQISKLNGLMSKVRQESLGIKSFIWRTMLDERVRPKHQDLEGEEFLWTEPPSEGYPGEPINCRCIAEPIFESMVG